MKTILCYGDSLTWGYDAATLARHAYEDRWPSVLEAELGGSVRVIAEGLNGRTTAFDDYLFDADRNGVRTLPTLLATHTPLDLVVIMLGANDMKPFICGDAFGSKQGMERLIDIVRFHPYKHQIRAPQVLIVAPPPLCDTGDADFAQMFAGGVEQSKRLGGLYAQAAALYQCGFLDAATVASTTPLDGVHLDAENTRALGKALAPIVSAMLEL